MTRSRNTIAAPAEVQGRGVHSGVVCALRLLPAPAGTGVVFRRVDQDNAEIPARLDNLVSDQLLRRTTLATAQAKVFTIEHVLSAAAGLHVDDLIVEMNTDEPPFVDGSAAPFAELITRAGIQTLNDTIASLEIREPIVYTEDGAEITALPSDTFRVTYFFSSDHPRLRTQSASIEITPDSYRTDVAPARTFCFFEEIEAMRRANLIKGANLSSAVVIGRKSIINDSLRFPDEPVRHKIVDFIGDLALLGIPLQGHFLVWRGGHRVNAAFALHLRKELGL